VIANCRYISPTRPPRNATGRNTAFSTSTIAITGRLTSRIASRVASRVDVVGIACALDVLEHDDRVVHHDADREHHAEQRQQLTEKPSRYMPTNVPTIDTTRRGSGSASRAGSAGTGTRPATTRTIASISVFTTSSIET
jgi:hypothetical protein